jgi:hypothetical protein
MQNIDWSKVQDTTIDFPRLTPGGYVCGILRAVDVPEKQYLRIEYDIAEGEFKNYYRDMKNRLKLEDWPRGGVLYRSYKDKALGMFKGFVTAVEASNNGYHFNNDEATLARKYIGMVFGLEEYLNQRGEVKTRLYVAQCRSTKIIHDGKFEVPQLKKLAANAAPAYAQAATPIVDAPAYGGDSPYIITDADDLPF